MGTTSPSIPTAPVSRPTGRYARFWYAGPLAVILMAGCLPSIYPLYTEKDLIFDHTLIGTWKESATAEDSWTFHKRPDAKDGEEALEGEGKLYDLVIRDQGKSSPFIARLMKLENQKFLDIQPAKEGLETLERESIYKSGLVRAHVFLRVRQIEPELQMQLLDLDWLQKVLEKDPTALRHSGAKEDNFALTAPTKELQAFVLQHSEDPKAWGDLTKLIKFPKTR